MTKVEAQLEAPFWVRYGKEWWVARYLEKRDMESAKKGSEVRRLWSRKVSEQKTKVVFYGSEQAAIVPTKNLKQFQENFIEFAKLAQANVEVSAGLTAARAVICPVKPRLEKVDCMHCHEPWSEEDLGENSTVLICEMCEEEFHLRCTRLEKIPKSDWICFSCRKAFPVIWDQILAEGEINESPSPAPEEQKVSSSSPPADANVGTEVIEASSKEADEKGEDEDADEDEEKSLKKGKKRKLERQESSEEPEAKAMRKSLSSSSTNTGVMDVASIKEALSVCYVPKVVAEQAKLSSWLDVDRNLWFLKLVAVANRSLKDNAKTAELLTDIVGMKEWKPKASTVQRKWKRFITDLHEELEELLQTVNDKPHSLRYVKFKINEIVEQILGYLAAKAAVVEPVEEDCADVTDSLIAAFKEHQVHLLKDKSEFKATVGRLLKEVGFQDAENAVDSEVYYAIKEQLTSDGARWPQKKPKRLSRENVIMACSFYKGVRAFTDAKKARTNGKRTALKNEKVEPKVANETTDASADIKIEDENNGKGGDTIQLEAGRIKKEETRPKKPNLSEQLLAFAAAEEKLAKEKLVEPAASPSKPSFELVPRDTITFAQEGKTWFSDKLAQRVRSIFTEAAHVKIEEEAKSATFCNSFPHCNELDLAAAEKEELIPILSEEHSEFAFMQPGPGWWGVVECGLEPCGDSDDDAAPKKKTFGV